MADGNSNGVTNGTTAVDVIAAPVASTTRMIPARGISLYNADTVAATGFFQLLDTAAVRIIKKLVIPVGETWTNDNYISLTTINQSLQIVMSAAATTTALDYVAKYRDEAQ